MGFKSKGIMNIITKNKRIYIFILIIISIITAIGLYDKGKIFSDDILLAYKKAFVNIRMIHSNGEVLYSEGYFIAKDKIAILYAGKLSADVAIDAFDMDEKVYSIKKIKHYKNFSVLFTNEKNNSHINYRYLISKNDKYVYTSIDNDFTLNKYDVLKYKEIRNGYKYMVCNGEIERISGGPVFDKNGRIIGMCKRSNDRVNDKNIFLVYSQTEMMKQIIISNIKEFFGID